VLVLKNVHKPGHFQYTIHYKGKSISCPRTQKGFTLYYMHFSSFKICSQIFCLVSAILHHISLLRLLPKSYFKISTFQPNFLCSSSFKQLKLSKWIFVFTCVQNRICNIIKACTNKLCTEFKNSISHNPYPSTTSFLSTLLLRGWVLDRTPACRLHTTRSYWWINRPCHRESARRSISNVP